MNYQKLFNYMSEEHGVTLLEQDMQEICNIVNEMQSNELRQPLVSGMLKCVSCDNTAKKEGLDCYGKCHICTQAF